MSVALGLDVKDDFTWITSKKLRPELKDTYLKYQKLKSLLGRDFLWLNFYKIN
ncbi:hypothetical protein C427_1629 [Paraglaciecola psychrophila 170]|uniref:Uncharacterized protein n=1 Tax=Paraglaciecola psychrophila 170 TaxID=1129794 RepID=K7A519_9ALTE|nr:hypothetical protein C427_1629 [Paraglaciecola psychrophila 170]GAC35948.1 hypothetical protein GPSY_0306 [Paraglaciecola psychrophila 170]